MQSWSLRARSDFNNQHVQFLHFTDVENEVKWYQMICPRRLPVKERAGLEPNLWVFNPSFNLLPHSTSLNLYSGRLWERRGIEGNLYNRMLQITKASATKISRLDCIPLYWGGIVPNHSVFCMVSLGQEQENDIIRRPLSFSFEFLTSTRAAILQCWGAQDPHHI